MDFFGPRVARVCPDCRGSNFVEDHAAGDIVCKGCGLVVEAHIIDERSEWRTFGDKDKEGDDPSRVGAASNDLFADGGLSTSIGKVQGDGGLSAALNRLHQRQTGSDRSLQQAVRGIRDICEKLNLMASIQDTAATIFKDVRDNQAIKGRAHSAIYAACIFVACKQQNAPRTFKEIGAAVPDARSKDIGRCFTAIDKMYKKKKQQAAEQRGDESMGALKAVKQNDPVQLAVRAASNLGWDAPVRLAVRRVAEAAVKAAQESNVPWAGRNPGTLASMVVYLLARLQAIKVPEEKPTSLEDVCAVIGMAPPTVRDLFLKSIDLICQPELLVDKATAGPEVLEVLRAQVAAAEDAKADKAKARKAAAAAAAAPGGKAEPADQQTLNQQLQQSQPQQQSQQ